MLLLRAAANGGRSGCRAEVVDMAIPRRAHGGQHFMSARGHFVDGGGVPARRALQNMMGGEQAKHKHAPPQLGDALA